jgi:hypothetical protein
VADIQGPVVSNVGQGYYEYFPCIGLCLTTNHHRLRRPFAATLPRHEDGWCELSPRLMTYAGRMAGLACD